MFFFFFFFFFVVFWVFFFFIVFFFFFCVFFFFFFWTGFCGVRIVLGFLMMMEDLVGQVICLFFRPRKNPCVFFLLYFRHDWTSKDRTKTYHSRQFPARVWKINFRALWKLLFSRFVSFCPFFFPAFRFLFIFFLPFFIILGGTKTKKQKGTKNKERKRFCFFM